MSSTLRWGYFRPLIFLVILTLNQLGCSTESETSFTFDGTKMHGPLGITVIPGEDIGLVISTNFDFSNTEDDPEQDGGIIHAIDLNSFELDAASAVQIPNFGGQIRVDTVHQQLFLADRNDSTIRVFDYTVPGSNGKIIDIEPVKTLDGEFKNPFSVFINKPTGSPFTKVFVANIETDDLTLIDADDLKFIDLNPNDDISDDLPLDEVAVGSVDLTDQLIRPNRLVDFGSDDLVLLSVTAVSLIYVFDTKNNGIEAIIDLQGIDTGALIHGMAVTNEKLAYLAFQGTDAIAVIDLSGLSDDGIDQETITPDLVQIIPAGGDIEDIKLSADGSKVYAANLSHNSVMVLDAISGTLLTEILVGSGPTEMALTDSGSELLVTNFFSDAVSVIDTATDTVTTTIK